MKQKTLSIGKRLLALILAVIMALALPAPKSYAKLDISKPGVSALINWIKASEDKTQNKAAAPCRVFYEDDTVRNYVALYNTGNELGNYLYFEKRYISNGKNKGYIELSFIEGASEEVYGRDIDIAHFCRLNEKHFGCAWFLCEIS